MKTLNQFLAENEFLAKYLAARNTKRAVFDTSKDEKTPAKPVTKRTQARRNKRYHDDMQKCYDSPSKIDRGYKGD